MLGTPRSIECWQFPEYQNEAMPPLSPSLSGSFEFLSGRWLRFGLSSWNFGGCEDRKDVYGDDEATVVRKKRADVQTPGPDTELRERIRNVTSTTFQIYDNTERTGTRFQSFSHGSHKKEDAPDARQEAGGISSLTPRLQRPAPTTRYRTLRKATRSFFSCAVRFVCITRLKNSTVSSSVKRRPS